MVSVEGAGPGDAVPAVNDKVLPVRVCRSVLLVSSVRNRQLHIYICFMMICEIYKTNKSSVTQS